MLERDRQLQRANGEYDGSNTRPGGLFGMNGKQMHEFKHHERENWLDFCMMPDISKPARMPSMFPIPTHLVRRQTVFNITIPSTGAITGMFKPVTIDSATSPTGYLSAFTYIESQSIGSLNNDATATTHTSASVTTQYAPSLASVSGLAHGGARLVGSFIEIDYIGTLENHSGMIEAGLHIHSLNSLTDMFKTHFYSQGEIIQAPFYRKVKPIEGIRCVWFPTDDSDFNFQDYDLQPTATGDPTIDIANITVRNPIQPQWAINLTGLQPGQVMRVHMCSYYECVPDEKDKDVYMSERSTNVSTPANARAAISTAVGEGMFVTPSKSSSDWGSTQEALKVAAQTLTTTFGLNNMGSGLMQFGRAALGMG